MFLRLVLLVALLMLSALPTACVPVTNEQLGDDDASPAAATPELPQSPTPTPATDADNDGFPLQDDCDDTDPAVYPGAGEACDGKDNDCDGTVDEGNQLALFHIDADGDGYGDAGEPVEACSAPPGHVADDTDCDDTDASIHPDAVEVCDGKDNDCDGTVDEDSKAYFYNDSDGDGHGDSANAAYTCTAPTGYVDAGGDCNDADPAIHPGAQEYCNGVDDDCDGDTDEDGSQDYLEDADLDGYGNPDSVISGPCLPPEGLVEDAGPATHDCDDADASIHPGALEACNNGVDDNCNGDIDEGAASAYYLDLDGDGFGDSSAPPVTACSGGDGYATNAMDCNDGAPGAHPAVVDAANGSSQGDGTEESPLATIQSGIDADNCGLVMVRPGEYYESIRVENKSGLAIRATATPETTILHRPGGQRVMLLIDSTAITISGLTLKGDGSGVGLSGAGMAIIGCSSVSLEDLDIQYLKSDGVDKVGGGMAVTNSTSVTMSGVLVRGNHAANGGGLAVSASSVTVTGSAFSGNGADKDGGGVLVSDVVILERNPARDGAPSVTIQGTTFTDNVAGDTGGGLRAGSGSVAEVEECWFENNMAAIRGGAVANPNVVRRCTFLENSVPGQSGVSFYGGALMLESESVVTNNLFVANEAWYGGAIDVNNFAGDEGEQTIVNNTFVDNDGERGATLFVFSADRVLFVNNIVTHFSKPGGAAMESFGLDFDYTVAYNDFYLPEGGDFFAGPRFDSNLAENEENFIDDPRFVQYPSSGEEPADFRLGEGSPCIDAGDPAWGDDTAGTDPDLGAYGGPDPHP